MYLTCMSFRLCEFISYHSSILYFYKCNRKSVSSSEKGRRKLPFCFSPADMKTKSIMKHMARLPLHRHPHVDLVECQSDLKKNKNDWTPKKGFSSPPLQELSSSSGLDSATRWKLTDMTVNWWRFHYLKLFDVMLTRVHLKSRLWLSYFWLRWNSIGYIPWSDGALHGVQYHGRHGIITRS